VLLPFLLLLPLLCGLLLLKARAVKDALQVSNKQAISKAKQDKPR
jgi:hypothetical protein